MKDNIVVSMLFVLFILWQIIILFAIWGGSPEGCFVKIKKLECRIVELEKNVRDMSYFVYPIIYDYTAEAQ